MQNVLEYLQEHNPEAVVICGFDDCLIGTCMKPGATGPVAVYSTPKVIEKLTRNNGGDENAAWDHFYNQIETVDMGVHGPWLLNSGLS